MNREIEVRKRYGLECGIPLCSTDISFFDAIEKKWYVGLGKMRMQLRGNNEYFSSRIGVDNKDLVTELNELIEQIESSEDFSERDSLKDKKDLILDVLIYKRLMREYKDIYSSFKTVNTYPLNPRETTVWK